MSNELFITASRNKVRYNTPSGILAVEDLWDLPLSGGRANLDDIAKGLHKQLKDVKEESFVRPASVAGGELQLMFDIVLFVIKAKMEERDITAKAEDRRAEKQKIMTIIAQKKDEILSSKSIEELQAHVNSLE